MLSRTCASSFRTSLVTSRCHMLHGVFLDDLRLIRTASFLLQAAYHRGVCLESQALGDATRGAVPSISLYAPTSNFGLFIAS